MIDIRNALDAVLQCGIVGRQSVEDFRASQMELLRAQRAEREHQRLMLVLKNPRRFSRSALVRGVHA